MIPQNSIWLLSFQITNWGGGILLYTALLYTVPAHQASVIFSAEALVGALGIFLTTLFLRAHLSVNPVKALAQARVIRLIIATGSIVLFFSGNIRNEMFYAALAVLITPVHLPILLGFSPVHTAFAAYKFVAAALMLVVSSTHLVLDTAIVYFLPTMAYGFSLWCYEHWAKREPRVSQSKFTPSESSLNIASQIFVTLAGCWAQSVAIPSIVALGPATAAIERSIRSAASFLYPHIALKILRSNQVDQWLAVIITALIALLIASSPYKNLTWLAAVFLLPTAVDLVNSLAAGKKWGRDSVLGCAFILFIWTHYV